MVLSSTAARAANYEVKASALRGYVSVLQRRGFLEELLRDASEGTRRVVASPPAASAWIDATPTEELMALLAEKKGLARVREVSREALDEGVVPLVLPLVSGILRLFGTSPATLLARTELLTRPNLRGVSFRFTSSGEKSGVMVLTFDRDREVPLHRFVAFAGAFELTLRMCRTSGVVDEPALVDSPERNSASYEIHWR